MTESIERLEFQIQVHERSLEQLRSFPPATTEEQRRDREKTIRWREEMLAELRAQLAALRGDSKAAPAPAALAQPVAPAAATPSRTAAAAHPDIPAAAPAVGPLAAEIDAGERALASGRAAVIGSAARTQRTRAARDFTAELAAADRAVAAGKAKIVQGGAALFPRPEPEPVETASKPLVERAKSRWDRDPALRAEFGYRFDQYLAYRKAAERQAARAGRR